MDRDKKVLAVLLIVLMGYGVRLLTFPAVFSGDRIVFLGADPYYHMRRVAVFPSLLASDSYMNYPAGAPVNWPPLYDLAISTVSFLVGLGNPSSRTVEYVGAYFPVLLGLLSLVAVYLIGREIFGEIASLFAVFVLALSPIHVQISFLGFTDHHISEVLFSVLIYLSFLKALKCGENIGLASFAENRRFLFFTVSTGVLIAVSLLTWLGAPIFIGILLVYSFIQFTVNSRRGVSSRPLAVTGIISILVSLDLLLLAYLAGVPWTPEVSQNFLSWFQVIFLLVNLLAYLLIYTVSRARPLYLVAAGILGVAGFLWLSSGEGGVSFLLRQDRAIQQISESLPMFYTFFGEFTLRPVWNAFALTFYTALAGLALLLYKKKASSSEVFFLVWTLVNFTLAILQRRFAYLLSVNLAILTGYLLYQLTIFNRLTRSNAIPVVVLVLVGVSSFQIDLALAENPPRPNSDWLEALSWLERATPATSSFNTPGYPPEYGVMNWWDYGHWIEYLSKRPVVANNFQLGLKESAEFLTSENETNANRLMDRHRARYVILDHKMGLNIRSEGNILTLSGTFPAIVSTLGQSFRDYLDPSGLPGRRYLRTMYARLYLLDGRGLQHYRLVYETRSLAYDPLLNRPVPYIKIFEYVPGAKIKGKTLPGSQVNLTLQILTNQGRRLTYLQATKADSRGDFNFTVPYPTTAGYEMKLNNQLISVSVSEDEVTSGGIIQINMGEPENEREA